MAKHDIRTDRNGVAIDGYDAVAYFTDGVATKGNPSHSHVWRGATWHFTSAENAATFAEDPERYCPQFGGSCAFGSSLGMPLKGSPKAWRIVDDQLFFLKAGPVRSLSHAFTGHISKAANK